MANKNILEYKPKIELKKKIDSSLEKINAIPGKIFTPSTMLQQLSDALPSKTLEALDAASKKIDNIIEGIENDIKDISFNGVDFKQYKEAIVSQDLDTVDKFEDDNARNLDGIPEVELYWPIKMLKDDLDAFIEFVKLQNYSQLVDLDEAKEKDKNNFNKLIDKEKSGETSQINYSSIFLDVLINNVIQIQAQNISDIVDSTQAVLDKNKSYKSDVDKLEQNDAIYLIMDTMFQNNIDTVYQDKIKLRQSLNSVLKTKLVSEVYDKRREFITTLSNLDALAKLPESTIKDKMVNSLNLLYNSISDTIMGMYKVFSKDIMYTLDYISTVGEKQETRNSYRAYKK